MLEARRRHEGLQGGHVRKGEVTAVSDVSFVVRPGEVVSLIGESGSGKTTIGRMILRLTAATAGAITFDGRDVSGLGRRELRDYYAHVQGVFQDPFSSYNPVFKVDRVLGMIRRATSATRARPSGRRSCAGRSRPSHSSRPTSSASTRTS